MTLRSRRPGLVALLAAAAWFGAPGPGFAPSAAFAAVDPAAKPAYDRAAKLFEEKRYREAMIEAKNALQSAPNDPEARVLLGKIFLSTNTPGAAETEFRRAFELGGSDEAQILLAEALMGQARFDDAVKTVTLEAATPEMRIRKRLTLGAAQIARVAPDLAEPHYQAALEMEPGRIEARYGLARVAVLRGDEPAAIIALDAILKGNPDYAPGWMMLGEVSLTRGDMNGAFAAFDRAIDLLPTNAHAFTARARARLTAGDLDGAKQDAARVAELSPRDPIVGYLRAAIYFAEGDLARADQEFNGIQQIFEAFPPAMLLGGLIKYRKGDLGQAEHFLGRYTMMNPSSAEAQRALAMVRVRSGQPLSAAQILERQLQREKPQSLTTRRHLAGAYVVADRPQEAVEQLRRLAGMNHVLAAREAESALALLGIGPNAVADAALGREILKGVELLRIGAADKAGEVAESLVERAPGNIHALNLLARVQEARGDLKGSRATLEAAFAVDPGFDATLQMLEALDKMAQDPAASLDRLGRAAAARPEDAGLALRYAIGLSEVGRGEEAERLLQQRVEANPGGAFELSEALIRLKFLRGDKEGAAREAHRLSQSTRDPAALAFAAAALRDAQAGAQALEATRRLAEVQPDEPRSAVMLAQAHFDKGDLGAARKVLNEARAKSPQDLLIARALVDLAVREKDQAGALAAAEALKAQDPVAAARFGADALLRLGAPGKAVERLAAAYQAKPDPDLALDLFSARRRAGQEAAAFEGLADWLRRSPDDRRALMVRAMSLQSAGKLEEAEVDYLRLLALDPSNPAALNNFAWLRHELGRHDALDYAERAYGVAASSPEVADTYGWLLVQNGRLRRGLEVLRAAVDTAPDNADARYHLAYALHQSGQTAEARTLLGKVLAESAQFSARAEAEALMARLK
ncbi:XrtA/PEP-CTERM system TPR-repeat protein PrsT [Neomegalonema sp.]|uniref:XrtA/PEP-CTERM system TPR-repeat protein PrsT n=1 Tax=Neomegalonema sp. TaxID=2039713 RepID=UPI00261E536A|nr:XrtA/PEP-CTERM system TPR-repeat protein PrsT [Neomegalonema sp.]MDD2869440.1 PEP-CTERM system TPR-repeat protein PrsT [Neomegalonema sp.]